MKRTMEVCRPVLILLATALAFPMAAQAQEGFDIYLWPNGRIPFRFAVIGDGDRWGDPAELLAPETQNKVRYQMLVWNAAMTVRDPRDNRLVSYIQFVECPDLCGNEDYYVVIRHNSAVLIDGKKREDNNYCGWRRDGDDVPGRHRDKKQFSDFHLKLGQDDNTIRHELGHCIGLWHEPNRGDRDSWLIENPSIDGEADWDATFKLPLRATLMPIIGNYDYDSIMHYESVKPTPDSVPPPAGCILSWTDWHGNQFSRYGLDPTSSLRTNKCRTFPTGAGARVATEMISERDRSRVLQYYAFEQQPAWGFFESLNATPARYDDLPDPFLARNVTAVGTPAVAYQSPGNYDVFVRGSDQRIYWKWFRRFALPFEPQSDQVGPWQSLGCCFDSDPSAISRADGKVEVVAIGADTHRPAKARYEGGTWHGWTYVRGDVPAAGIKRSDDGGYIGPAIASRSTGSLDVFVVDGNGLMHVSTQLNGVWSPWRPLGSGYNVTARPAAVALSSTRVKLAINESDTNLYEPEVSFVPATFALGSRTAFTAKRAAPALTYRADVQQPYRVLIVTPNNRIGHRFAGGAWRDIGGVPRTTTGVSAATAGSLGALIAMNGEDAVGCKQTCLNAQPAPGGTFIRPGGIWIRKFHWQGNFGATPWLK